jgi:hypothetical protein
LPSADWLKRVKGWTLQIDFFDPDYDAPCPRCGKPCRWECSVTIPLADLVGCKMLWPMCPCPDDHIRSAIAKLLADALVADYRRTHGGPATDADMSEGPRR